MPCLLRGLLDAVLAFKSEKQTQQRQGRDSSTDHDGAQPGPGASKTRPAPDWPGWTAWRPAFSRQEVDVAVAAVQPELAAGALPNPNSAFAVAFALPVQHTSPTQPRSTQRAAPTSEPVSISISIPRLEPSALQPPALLFSSSYPTQPPTFPAVHRADVTMPGLVSATGVLGFLADEEPELKVFALKTLNDDIDTVWTEVAGSLSNMYAPHWPLSVPSSLGDFV